MRIVFMGTPEFSVPTLEAVAGAGHEIVAAYTRVPQRGGRGMAERKSPLHLAAERLSVPVSCPKSLRGDEAAAAFSRHGADVAVVVAYGLILPPTILSLPRFGCLNLHGSLLPRWRGAAPINRAIMAGDSETGVEVMRMDEGLDTGPVAMTAHLALQPDETAGELHDRMAGVGAKLMVEALDRLAAGTLVFTPQPSDGVCYAARIDKAEARIDWSRPARDIHRLICGLSPFPGAWFEADLGKGIERVKVLRSTLVAARGAPGRVLDAAGTIAAGDGALRLIEVQRAGSKPMAFGDFARGAKFDSGTVLC